MSRMVRALVALLLLGLWQCAAAFAPGEVPLGQLPREARETLALIKAGGPFPYDRDGVVFGNQSIKVGTPIELEGGLFRVGGTVSGLQAGSTPANAPGSP